jgi:hypothetical protein
MKKFQSIIFLVILGLIIFSSVSAQTGLQPPSKPGGLWDASGGAGLSGLILQIINIVLAISGSMAVLFMIIGGFQYILSGANEDLAKRGKTTLTNSVIGLIIIVLSYTVVSVVYNTLTNVRV